MDIAALGSVAMGSALTCCVAALAVAGRSHRWGRRVLLAAALLASLATSLLAWALVAGDFSLVYVADTTSRLTPAPFRLAALWAAMDGSLLFFATLVTWMAVAAQRYAAAVDPAMARKVLRLGAGIAGVILSIGVVVASPFAELQIPAVDGGGLVAILRHPAMLYHPPILYLGLTASLVPALLTLAAGDRVSDRSGFDARVRRSMLVAWTLLTVGMTAGSNWAYIELGWGGFWAWDPVENTSLLPWLAATAYLHTRPGERWRDIFATAPFLLVLFGSFLTRSGATGSVHSFAEEAIVGRLLLLLVAALVVTTVIALARKSPRVAAGAGDGTGRAALLRVNRTGLLWAGAVVLAGSAAPAIFAALGEDGAIVAASFYVLLLLPLALVMPSLMAGALVPETRTRATVVQVLALGVIAGAAAAWAFADEGGEVVSLLIAAVAAAALAAALAVGLGLRSLRSFAAWGAHVGFLLVLLAAAASGLGSSQRIAVQSGDRASIPGYTIVVDAIETVSADDYEGVRIDLTLRRGDSNGTLVATLAPELRAYTGQFRPTPEPVVHAGLWEDVVVGVSRLAADASVVELMVFTRPLVTWVWIGAVLLALSGLGLLVAAQGVAGPRPAATTTLPPVGTTSGTSAPTHPAPDRHRRRHSRE